MSATRLLKNAALYQGTHNRYDATTSQIVTTTATGEQLVHNTLSTQDAIGIRDGLLEAHPLSQPAPAPAPPAPPAPQPPAPVPPVPPAPTAAPSEFQLGVVLASNWPGLAAKAKAAFGPTLGRISDEAADSAVQQMVSEARQAGMTPHACFTGWQASPATFVAFVKRYQPLGVRRFEIGNETSYVTASQVPSTAAAYAKQVEAFGDALKTAGVTGVELLVQADDALRNAGWVANMFKAVPDLGSYAAGWVVHPYTAGREVERLNRAVTDLQAQGVTDPAIYATEYGIASTVDGVALVPDNYGHPTNLTWRDCGPLLAQTIDAMRAGCPNLRALFVYHATDGNTGHNQRESNFGVMTWPSLTVKADIAGPLKAYADAVKALGA
jgi:hypothetical protein